MRARIYKPARNAMQSGKVRTLQWVLEYEPAAATRPDPLSGWAGSGDTRDQVRLGFATLDAACAYADREGLPYHVVADTPQRAMKIRTYAENFK